MPSARRGTTFAEILRSGVGGQSFDCREALGLLARLPKAHRFLHAQPAFGARTQQPFQARSAILPVELPPSPLPPPTFNCRCLYRQFAMKKTPLLTRGAAQSQVTHPNPAVEANFNPPRDVPVRRNPGASPRSITGITKPLGRPSPVTKHCCATDSSSATPALSRELRPPPHPRLARPYRRFAPSKVLGDNTKVGRRPACSCPNFDVHRQSLADTGSGGGMAWCSDSIARVRRCQDRVSPAHPIARAFAANLRQPLLASQAASA